MRRLVVGALLASLLLDVSWAASIGMAATQRVSHQRSSPGACVLASKPFGLGSLVLDLVDPTTERSLPTVVNYPAPADAAGPGAVPACGHFPLLILGHGSALNGASAVAGHAFLTQRGYVLAGPTYPAGFDFHAYPGDVSFVLTRILAIAASEGSPLSGAIRTDRVGYIGTSLGGMIGLSLYQSCCLDPRIDAVVSKLGMAPNGTYSWRKGPPLLMINGDADPVIPYTQAVQTYEEAHRPKGLISLAGVGHGIDLGDDSVVRDATLGFFSFFLKGRRHGVERLIAAVDLSPVATLRAHW
jgi:hypothetical protein